MLFQSEQSRSFLLQTFVVLATALFAESVTAQQFRNSIVSTEFDFITDDDPSAFEELKFVRHGKAEMPDKRTGRELWGTAFEFAALFSDNTQVDIFVDATNKDQKSAQKEAMRYIAPLGKLPTALRQGVNRLCVHSGGKTTTAFSDVGLIVVYADNATVRISNHDLEETIFHESVHAAWDAKHAKSEGWKRAQMQDGDFATVYARSKPALEDLAETALFAYTIIHHPERLPADVRAKLVETVGNRIFYVEQLIPEGKPIHFPVQKSRKQDAKPSGDAQPALCNIRLPGTAADIIATCLLSKFELPEEQVVKLMAGAQDRYDTSEAVFQAAINTFKLDAEKLRKSVLDNLHCNCKEQGTFNKDFDDSELRKLIKSWKTPDKSK